MPFTASIHAWRLASSRDGSAWLVEHRPEGLLGPLSGVLRVRAGFEAAVAAVLGPVADAVAAESGESAHAAIRALKDADGGRAALVFGVASETGERSDDPVPSGAHRLADVVECPPELRAGVLALTTALFSTGMLVDW